MLKGCNTRAFEGVGDQKGAIPLYCTLPLQSLKIGLQLFWKSASAVITVRRIVYVLTKPRVNNELLSKSILHIILQCRKLNMNWRLAVYLNLIVEKIVKFGNLIYGCKGVNR